MTDQTAFNSPQAVTVGWTYLSKADEFKGKKKYKVQLLLDPQCPEHDEFMTELDVAAQKAFDDGNAEAQTKGGKAIATAKNVVLHPPYEPQYDDEGNETGLYIVKFSANADYTKDGVVKEVELRYKDSKGTTCKRPVIYTGSELSLSGVMVPYFSAGFNKAGVSLRLYEVQIHQLTDRDGEQPGWTA